MVVKGEGRLGTQARWTWGCGDFDGDAKLDLVTANSGYGQRQRLRREPETQVLESNRTSIVYTHPTPDDVPSAVVRPTLMATAMRTSP